MPKVQPTSDGKFLFFCPGCKCGHWFKTTPPEPQWTFNGDMEKPTVRASILVKSKRYPSGGEFPTDEEYDRMMKEGSIGMVNWVCHSFVTDGNIQFLDDCTHELKGKTVPLEDF